MSKFNFHKVSVDAIKDMGDDDLDFLYKKYKKLIYDANGDEKVINELEVECCYLQREMDSRMRVRKFQDSRYTQQ